MIAVIFEVRVHPNHQQDYLDTAAALRPLLAEIDGFISIERFQSLGESGKLLSLSFWRDEAAVQQWRTLEAHRLAQTIGRERVFTDYQLSVAEVTRRYGMHDRHQAPPDSQKVHSS
ncbi:antibiotic biosynthesis monooxygenase [Burkholderiaceae bacterium DAT-1]|nr:antibiotic biosynthesis monooxygenase [Burkholderiaceae bacterium DAT-1]